MRAARFLGVLACAALSCSSRGGAGDGGTIPYDGGPPDAGSRCRSDADCTPRVCDLRSGACVQRPPCATSTDCDGGVCNRCNQTCEPAIGAACVSHVNCGILDSYCDPCTSRCKPAQGLCEACTDDFQCAEGNRCLAFDGGARACGRDCSLFGCPVGYVCSDEPGGARQCRPCAGACGAPGACSRDSDCGFRQFCNVQPGVCPRCTPGCTDDLDCPGLRCHDNGRCAPACPGTACPTGYVCADGRCVIPGACTENADCRDAPNPPNHCDLSRNRCAPGCDEDNDCLPVATTQGTRCDRATGRCVKRPCSGTFACGFQEFCNLQTGSCFPASGTYCRSCQQDSDCACRAGDSCPPGPHHCLEIKDTDGGTRGKFCFLGGCNRDGGPETGCPQGYACEELPTPQGGSYNACFRACWE